MTKQFSNYKNEFIPIILILIASTILRFWNFYFIPFTHDEFSALFRTQYSNFYDLIKNGVMPDGHPAGIQIFLYYWIKIFGFSEFWVKLPFTLMGVFSVWILYLIAKEWFGEKTALLASSSMAFMQYFIMYSQIARPYISGLFFTLIMTNYWHKLLFSRNENHGEKFKYIIGFVIGASLCNYNHYFSMMMVVLISAIGIIYLNKDNYKPYLLSLVLIVLFFIPHLKIFFYQLGLRGLGWLGVPTSTFFIDFLSYLFHYNIYLLAGVLIFFFVSFLYYLKKRKSIKKEHVFVFILAVFPFIIGYFYSIYRAPVLQYSCLIFSAPFLLMLLFSFSDIHKNKLNNGITLLLSVLLILTLILQRKHYRYFYQSIYQETFNEIYSFGLNHSFDSTLVICNFRKEIGDFYLGKFNTLKKVEIFYPSLLNSKKEIFKKLVEKKYKYLIFNTVTNSDFEFFSLVKEYFPEVVKKIFLNGGEIWILSKGYPNYIHQYVYFDENNFKLPTKWNFDTSMIVANNYYKIDSAKEYDINYSMVLDTLSKAYIIDFSAWILLPKNFNNDAHLVASIEKDSVLIWRGRSINKNELSNDKWHAISVSLLLPDVRFKIDSSLLKLYFWNPNHETFFVSKTSIGIRRVNPAIYWISSNFIK